MKKPRSRYRVVYAPQWDVFRIRDQERKYTFGHSYDREQDAEWRFPTAEAARERITMLEESDATTRV